MIVALALLFVGPPLLWHDSGPPEKVNFVVPARATPDPKPPFHFVREDMTGTSPKVIVRDASGRYWQVKGGPEGRAEAFVTRLVAALGYYTDSVCFVAEGRIENIPGPLKRAAGFIQSNGRFTYAGFELRDTSDHYLADKNWTWLNNPFAGSQELKGLKILVMLVSNWDNKDGRDHRMGSNTGILETIINGQPRSVYFVNDWGQSLGAWGLYRGRSNWNCADYTRQTPDFITGAARGRVMFGFGGQHTADFSHDITVGDVRWLLTSMGRVTDEQIRSGLRASGASPQEEQCFARALRQRIDALRQAVKTAESMQH